MFSENANARRNRLTAAAVMILMTVATPYSDAGTSGTNAWADAGFDAASSPWQVKYARWLADYAGCWEGSIRKNEGCPAPAFVMDGDLWSSYGKDKWGIGYVLIGQKIRLPEKLPASVEFTASVQAFSSKQGERGLFRLVVLPVAYWDTLSSARAGQKLYQKSKELYGSGNLVGVGPDLLEWTEIRDRSPALREKLAPYAKQEVVIALQWGGAHIFHEEWGKADNLRLHFGTPPPGDEVKSFGNKSRTKADNAMKER